jgi:uncharacterized membrane protein
MRNVSAISRHLLLSRSGVAALEFALILPLFLALMGAGIEVSSLILTNMKVQRLATMIANMVAQRGASESQISEAQIYDIFSAMDLAAEPLDIRGHGRVIISAVLGEDTNSDGTPDLNRIKWQRFEGKLTSANRLIGCWSTNSSTAAIGRQLRLTEPLFHAQVSYAYQPIFGGGLLRWFHIPQTVTRTATFRGRGAIYKEVLSVENYQPKTNCSSANGL